MPEPMRSPQDSRETWPFYSAVALFLIVLPLLNVLPPEDSWLHLSDFRLNQFGKFLCFAILAIGLDLTWGYCGVLSLGQGVFFGFGAYCMGMYLALQIGKESVYGSDLPDFMVWTQVKELPWFWVPFKSFWAGLLGAILVPVLFATIFGFLAFRSRIKGVYFAIITQALAFAAWLVFNRNETRLGGTNGLTDFKQILGFRLSDPATQRGLYILTVLALIGAYLLCRWIVESRTGKVLVAIRDSESRVVFSGYTPWVYKLFVFVVAAGLAGLAGLLYVPQVGIITPAQIGVLPSLEVVIWVAVGGRGTLVGAVLGAVTVNYGRSVLTNYFPEAWPFILGGLFVVVVTMFPDGLIGIFRKLFSGGPPAPGLAVQKAQGGS
ncbi:urea ABC transporter permease subunit UrtC [Candidatus Nitrospira inopinata]|jgi:urea transport system permease protein|uniref:Urea ABC transporter, permease protein UrtC n=1 Tax=Candidatus Nitrospira inopinata TaxID=1715989 RepID=A0A0S4KVB5_9BACT|nr:urea ABC transporter permease subunit UrtC [Candidatus Nitrospira inopinata]CUQ68332.1 Urea ABC transporter, permease protein UrtC [Candidatus Nitrospira inopinata]